MGIAVIHDTIALPSCDAADIEIEIDKKKKLLERGY